MTLQEAILRGFNRVQELHNQYENISPELVAAIEFSVNNWLADQARANLGQNPKAEPWRSEEEPFADRNTLDLDE